MNSNKRVDKKRSVLVKGSVEFDEKEGRKDEE